MMFEDEKKEQNTVMFTLQMLSKFSGMNHTVRYEIKYLQRLITCCLFLK